MGKQRWCGEMRAVDGARRESPTPAVVRRRHTVMRHHSPFPPLLFWSPLSHSPFASPFSTYFSRCFPKKRNRRFRSRVTRRSRAHKTRRRCAHTLPVDGCAYGTIRRRGWACLCSIPTSSQPPVPRCVPGSVYTRTKTPMQVFARKKKTKTSHPIRERKKEKKSRRMWYCRRMACTGDVDAPSWAPWRASVYLSCANLR